MPLESSLSIFVISNRPNMVERVTQSLAPLPVTWIDGQGANSFSELVNRCIQKSPTEYVIVCGDKVRPRRHHLELILKLLDDGFALVAPFRFGFFGLSKETIRRIGFFDERFVGGTCEDCDFIFRLREADLAIYQDELADLEYQKGIPGSWVRWRAIRHYHSKWYEPTTKPLVVQRRLLESKHPQPSMLGPSNKKHFRPWRDSQLRVPFYLALEDRVISARTSSLKIAYLEARGALRSITFPHAFYYWFRSFASRIKRLFFGSFE